MPVKNISGLTDVLGYLMAAGTLIKRMNGACSSSSTAMQVVFHADKRRATPSSSNPVTYSFFLIYISVKIEWNQFPERYLSVHASRIIELNDSLNVVNKWGTFLCKHIWVSFKKSLEFFCKSQNNFFWRYIQIYSRIRPRFRFRNAGLQWRNGMECHPWYLWQSDPYGTRRHGSATRRMGVWKECVASRTKEMRILGETTSTYVCCLHNGTTMLGIQFEITMARHTVRYNPNWHVIWHNHAWMQFDL